MKTAPQQTCMLSEVCDLVRKSAKIPPGIVVHGDSHLVEDLAIDSLDLIQVILQIQDHFEIVIDEDAVANFCRVGDLAAYLSEQGDSSGL